MVPRQPYNYVWPADDPSRDMHALWVWLLFHQTVGPGSLLMLRIGWTSCEAPYVLFNGNAYYANATAYFRLCDSKCGGNNLITVSYERDIRAR